MPICPFTPTPRVHNTNFATHRTKKEPNPVKPPTSYTLHPTPYTHIPPLQVCKPASLFETRACRYHSISSLFCLSCLSLISSHTFAYLSYIGPAAIHPASSIQLPLFHSTSPFFSRLADGASWIQLGQIISTCSLQRPRHRPPASILPWFPGSLVPGLHWRDQSYQGDNLQMQ